MSNPSNEPPAPEIFVPRPTEAEGHPIVHFLLDARQHPYFNSNTVDVEGERDRLRRFLAIGEPYMEFRDLFGEAAYMTRYAAERCIGVVRGYAKSIAARPTDPRTRITHVGAFPELIKH